MHRGFIPHPATGFVAPVTTAGSVGLSPVVTERASIHIASNPLPICWRRLPVSPLARRATGTHEFVLTTATTIHSAAGFAPTGSCLTGPGRFFGVTDLAWCGRGTSAMRRHPVEPVNHTSSRRRSRLESQSIHAYHVDEPLET